MEDAALPLRVMTPPLILSAPRVSLVLCVREPPPIDKVAITLDATWLNAPPLRFNVVMVLPPFCW